MKDIFQKITESYNDARPSALCIITETSGSAPGKTGAKMIVFSDGSICGTVGGGNIEKKVIETALTVISENVPKLIEYNLQNDLSMTCGGHVKVYIEPLVKPAKLYIFGAGHIGKMLAKYAPEMGFEVYLVDWRTELLDGNDKPACNKICKPYLDAIKEINFDTTSYCVIVTPNHEMDEAVLAALGKKDLAYIGLIGSKRKTETIKKSFLENKTLTEDEIKRVDMPIGIKFNAVTPAEIAISILAKLIDVKNTRNS